MNPHEHLSSDHLALRKDAQTLQATIEAGSDALLNPLLAFQKSVQRHFQKEDPYYRILDDGKRLEDRGMVHQLRNDHAAIIFSLESLLIRLRKSGATPDWKGRFDTMMKVFLAHLDLEDTVLFPKGKTMLTAIELEQISAHIQDCE